MRYVLSDIVRHTVRLFGKVVITGTETETKISATDEDKTLFLKGTLKQPVPEFAGEFALSDLALLDGLLEFASYKTDTAKFSVVRRAPKAGGEETVTGFKFQDSHGTGSNYRTMSASLAGVVAAIAPIPWDVKVTPSTAKIAEFAKLTSLYSNDKFGVMTIDGNLVMSVGESSDSTHNATMVFATDIIENLKVGDLYFNTSQFLSILKLAGSQLSTVDITSRGVLGVVIDTPHAGYTYYMRAKR